MSANGQRGRRNLDRYAETYARVVGLLDDLERYREAGRVLQDQATRRVRERPLLYMSLGAACALCIGICIGRLRGKRDA
jgi:hypothetical protein